MVHWTPARKYAFDVAIIALSAVAVVPVLLLCIAGILVLEGRPVFYVSSRRVYRDQKLRVIKFRTMKRDADRIANRDTVPVTSTRFLNIDITSPLYTPIGRGMERLMLTELPQLLHVLQGRMSLIGNRPLPENVIAALREEHPQVEERFSTVAGLTGPVQLVGRDHISDADRLRLEIAYARIVSKSYSMWLDFLILFYTVVVGFIPSQRFTPEQVFELLQRYGASQGGWLGSAETWPARRRLALPVRQKGL